MAEFAWPWLLLAVPLPLLAAWLLPRAKDHAAAALRLPHAGLGWSHAQQHARAPALRRMLAAIAWLLLVLAAARPQWVGEPEDVPRSGRDLLLAVDSSGSMSIGDMQVGNRTVDRYTAVKLIVGDFIRRREGDRVGLVLFGSRAYLLTPLTFDLKTVASQLNDSSIGLAGRETAIGDALGLAVKRLLDRPEEQRVVVLLTDGVSNAGELDPAKATELAVANHVRVYTIAMGADAMEVSGFFGRQIVNPSADIDTSMLKNMASQTGGQFYRARNSAELAGIYRDIERLEPISDSGETLRPIRELYPYPLALALLTVVVMLLLPWLAELRPLRGSAT